jgi:hypothetical protein
MEIAPERLREIREALLFGDAIDGDMRLELLAVIERSDLARPRRGRRMDEALRRRAGVVGVLHERHGVTLKAALTAAWPEASGSQRAGLERAYRRLRNVSTVKVPERLVRAALAVAKRRK